MKLKTTSRSSIVLKLAFCASLFLVATVSSQADERGKQLYKNCIACHGAEAEGNKAFKAPALAALSEKYLVAQLTKYKEGHRGMDVRDVAGLQMAPMTQTLSGPEDIAAVAKYIASLESTPKEATLDGDPEKGKTAYATCAACHGADAAGNDLLNSPSLLHQYDWYTLAQLKNFKEGIRGTHPSDITGSQMRPMAMLLADEQAMKDIVAYIQTLSN